MENINKDNDIFENESDSMKISGVIDPLKHLVYLAHYGYQMSVTLNVRGAIISGILVGRKEFMDEFSKQVTSLVVNTKNNNVSGFEDYIKLFDIADDEEDVWREGLSTGNLQHVYLLNAKIISSSNTNKETLHGGIWCGDVNSVDGVLLNQTN